MEKSQYRIAAVSLFFGALLTAIAALTIGSGLFLRLLPIRVTGTPSNPNDSPVTVRGGSIEIATPTNQVSETDGKVYNEYVETSSMPNFSIYLHGVTVDGATTPPWGAQTQPIENDGLSNWEIVVWDRDKNAGISSNTRAIEMCSAAPSNPDNGCDAPSKSISGGNNYTTYILVPTQLCKVPADMKSEGKRDLFLLHDPADDTVTKCGAPPPWNHKHDHIGLIQVTLAGLGTAAYDCTNGQCSVSIGGAEP